MSVMAIYSEIQEEQLAFRSDVVESNATIRKSCFIDRSKIYAIKSPSTLLLGCYERDEDVKI